MSFETFINIGKARIAEVIAQRLLVRNISVKNSDISIWQEILDTVQDDENLQINNENPIKEPDSPPTNDVSEPPAKLLDETPVLLRLNLQAEYSEFPFDANGDIDFNELAVGKLRERYPEPDYTVEINSEDGELIMVKSNKDGKAVLIYQNTTNSVGDKWQVISFDQDSVPTALVYYNGKFLSRDTYNIDEKVKTMEYFDDNRNLVRREIWNEDYTNYVEQVYSNGILCKETTYTKTDKGMIITDEKDILSDILIPNITNRINAIESGIGFPPRVDNLVNNILNGISPNTVSTVLTNYNRTTGRELIQDIIDNRMALDYETQKELLIHLTSVTSVTSQGYELQFALKNKDKEMLKEALDKVNKDNVEYVLSTIFNTTGGNSFTDYSDELYGQLLSILGAENGTYITKLSNIMIEHINEQGGYTKDIIEDWNSNLDNPNGIAISFTRLVNRCQAGQNSAVTGKPDGKIDINNIQQKGTGDCWLLAAVLSATNKNQQGLDYINSMLSVDADGNVTVELKGVNKKYVITAEEIEKSNHLASGDPDMRAIEIAMDRYMKERVYTSDGQDNFGLARADINGDYTTFAYQVLFGNGYVDRNPMIMLGNYNAENAFFSISFDMNPNISATIQGDSNKQREVDLRGKHSYAIKGSDENYIYLINPHDSSQTLRVERELLQSKNPIVYIAEFNIR